MFQQLTKIHIIVILVLFFFTWFIYTRIVKPYRIYKYYKKQLSSKYRAKINPFTFLGVANIKNKQEALQKYNDAHHYAKTQFTNYDIRLLKVGNQIVIDLISPKLIKEFFEKAQQNCYQKNLNHPSVSSLKQIVGEGLFLSQGEQWKKKKKILKEIFNFGFIHSKVGMIAGIAQECYKQVHEKAEKAKNMEAKVNIGHLFQKLFGNVVIRCFFGNIKIGKIQDQQIFAYVQKMLQLNRNRWQTPLAFLLGKNFYKYGLRAIDREVNRRAKIFNAFVEDLIGEIIRGVKENQGKQDERHSGIIQWIIRNDRLTAEGKQDGEKYTSKELISEVATFFLAGTETTATMATMLIYTLANKPQIMTKLRTQIDTVLGDKPWSQISEVDLKKCSYLDCVIRETLRMYSPVAAIGIRQVVKQHYLGDIFMQEGLQVSAKIQTNHYKSEFYSQPFDFRPQRWQNVQVHKLPQLSYFPFSAGHRVCIGQHLSHLQAKIAIICFLREFKKIELEKKIFKMYQRAVYGPQALLTTLGRQ